MRADVGVRTGTGAVAVADARAGRLDLTTGSGGLTIGVHAGVLAELDLSSGSGRARSELDVRRTAPAARAGAVAARAHRERRRAGHPGAAPA